MKFLTDEEKQIRFKFINKHKYCHEKWYIYENHKWKLDDNLRIINKVISQSNINKYIRNKIFKRALNDPKFLKKINKNKNLIGFNNGVYDLKKQVFRDGKPSDYITFSTNYDYQIYDANDKNIVKVNNFLFDLFQDNLECKKVIDILSSFLKYKFLQDAYVFLGRIGSGKSTLERLILDTFGDYASRDSFYAHRFDTSDFDNENNNNECVICLTDYVRNKKIIIYEDLNANPNRRNLIKGTSKYRILYHNTYHKYRANIITFADINLSHLYDDAIYEKINIKSRFTKNPDNYSNIPYLMKQRNLGDLTSWYPAFMAILLNNLKYNLLAKDLQNDIIETALQFRFRCPIQNNKNITGGYEYHQAMINYDHTKRGITLSTYEKNKLVEDNFLYLHRPKNNLNVFDLFLY